MSQIKLFEFTLYSGASKNDTILAVYRIEHRHNGGLLGKYILNS